MFPSKYKDFYDPVRDDFNSKTKLHKYSCYYPQQRITSKFTERNCDSLAVLLWKKAYPDIDHEMLVKEMFGDDPEITKRGQNLHEHLKNIPVLDKDSVSYNAEFTYKRVETLNFFIKQDLEKAQGDDKQIIEKLKQQEMKSQPQTN